MPGVDYIFHAAALKQVPSCEFFPMQAVQTNIIGTDNVLHAAIDAGVKRVVCLSRKKNTAGKKIRYKINRRPSQSKNNSARSQSQIKRREHEKSSVRAKVEHVFAVLKLQLRYRKTRYRGLQKQTAKVNILLALANLILADRPCLTA